MGHLFESVGHDFNDLTIHSIESILSSGWYDKTLEESWDKLHPMHLPRCYLACGDDGKRAVIKQIEN